VGVFLYLGANWFQQDYFSPQASVFLLYLTVLATLLWSAQHAHVPALSGGPRARVFGAWRRTPGLPAGMTRGESLALEAAILVLSAAIVVAHQLTPVTMVITLLLFVLTGRTRYRRLWLAVALLFLAWFSYAATDFWSGHLTTVFGDLGKLGSNLNSGVVSRVAGNPTYQLMQNVRIAWSVAYLLLALAGLWRIRRRADALLIGLLVASTGSLVLMQSYGGEVVFRVFVYASPLLAPLAAVALRGLLVRPNAVRVVALTVVIAVAALIGTAARGVNVSFERVTADDLAAARVLWAHSHPGDTIGYLSPAGAYAANDVGENTPVSLAQADCGSAPLQCAVTQAPTFILLSRSQDAAEQLIESAPPGTTTRLASELVSRGLYTVLYHGPDAEVLMRSSQGR
jgi:hypothetical protein